MVNVLGELRRPSKAAWRSVSGPTVWHIKEGKQTPGAPSCWTYEEIGELLLRDSVVTSHIYLSSSSRLSDVDDLILSCLQRIFTLLLTLSCGLFLCDSLFEGVSWM